MDNNPINFYKCEFDLNLIIKFFFECVEPLQGYFYEY